MRSSTDDFYVRAADDPSSLLVVVLDVSAASWIRITGKESEEAIVEATLTLQAVTEQLLVFLNAFLLLHEANRTCFILASPNGANLVYPVLSESSAIFPNSNLTEEDNALDGGVGADRIVQAAEYSAMELRDAVVTGIKDSLRLEEGSSTGVPPPLSTALAKALCLHNRVGRISAAPAALSAGIDAEANADSRRSNGRIFAVLAGHDAPEQYVPVMNCIFAAQRMGVVVDSCVLAQDQDSTYFQQAAHLTNGVYLRPEDFSSDDPNRLIQVFQTVYLADRQSRDFLAMPVPDKVDFRASCMETRQTIDNGYTCSVCLSTFDVSVGRGAAMCPVCSARFAVTSRTGRRPPRP